MLCLRSIEEFVHIMASQQYYHSDDTVKSKYGYPTPGKQNVTAEDIMNCHYFMTKEEWDDNRKVGNRFDYVIIGSSFCALAFITQALKNNPNAKILIIERGTYLHPDHFQNLHPAFENTVDAPSETFPWRVTQETIEGEHIKGLHGAYNFFGGRSSFWSGWCPEPTEAQMEGWPKEIIKVVKDHYFSEAKKLLNIISADEIFSNGAHHQPIFGDLQSKVQSKIKEASAAGTIETVQKLKVVPAPLAVQAKTQRYEYYHKYSVIGPLLSRLNKKTSAGTEQRNLQAVINCLVKKIQYDNGKATVLETSKGDFILGESKLVLAMGILPSTTLVLNSFPKSSFPALRHVGERFTAHFISSITARVPLSKLSLNLDNDKLRNMELGAVYVAGVDKISKHQFHVQITAVRDKTPDSEESSHDRIRHLPDVLASPSLEQLQTSKDHVIFTCACLGELDHKNDKNWFRLLGANEKDHDITCNASLQVVANDYDNALWDTMDKSTFQLLENILPLQEGLEYWHSGGWKDSHPPQKQRRHDGLVHEASTMWIGGDDDTMAPVGLDYRLHGLDNVYITGASLWPKGGSWNPVGTIVSMAMHLADKICEPTL